MPFEIQNGEIHCDGVSLRDIAERFGTPCYVYSTATLDNQCRTIGKAFDRTPTWLCYAVKANTTGALLRRIFGFGLGADVVSAGELHRSLQAGAQPDKIVFSGAGKTDPELEMGLEKEIAFNVESIPELVRLDTLAAKQKRRARILLRVNPGIEAGGNEYIATGHYSTKFGIPETHLAEALAEIKARTNLMPLGLGCHLGSQIIDLDVFDKAAQRMASLLGTLRSLAPEAKLLNLGGGLGVRYHDENPPSIRAYAQVLQTTALKAQATLVLEPGRWLVAESGGLLTRVVTSKHTGLKHFLIVDAGMNDLIRPALYGAYHPIEPVIPRKGPVQTLDVVGPVCETGDFLALERQLPPVECGDLLWVGVCGAYGSTMASQYNSRLRPAEVWVEDGQAHLIRQRDSFSSLTQFEV